MVAAELQLYPYEVTSKELTGSIDAGRPLVAVCFEDVRLTHDQLEFVRVLQILPIAASNVSAEPEALISASAMRKGAGDQLEAYASASGEALCALGGADRWSA
jgi:hypothetical protein